MTTSGVPEVPRAIGLLVEVEGRTLRLTEARAHRIGRAIEADVVLTAGSVSRQHAELRPYGDGWMLVDTGSQFGTFLDGCQVSETPILGRVTVRCGPQAAGAELVVTPISAPTSSPPEPTGPPPPPVQPAQPAPPAAPPGVPPVPPSVRPVAAPAFPEIDQTQVLAATRAEPADGAPATPRTGPDLLLIAEGREHRFRHPARITLGRLPESTVVLRDPSASRRHGQIEGVPGAWIYTNLSGEGSFVGGRRVTTLRFDDRVGLRLGHPVAGPEVTLVPILSALEEERRIRRRRLRQRLAIAGAGAAAVLLLVGAAVAGVLVVTDDRGMSIARDSSSGAPDASAALIDPDTPGELAEDELDAAKAATVKISAESHLLSDPSQTPIAYGGSGSILREDGLILTNAHVAAPEAPGIVEQYGQDEAIADPDYLLISLTDGMTDTSAPAQYRARVVEADGRLDVAILQIYARADGSDLDAEPDLPTVPLGTSADLRAGDDVTILGFPAVAGAGDSITVTTGVISTVINDPELGPRSELDTDARIAPGNSGGMAIDNAGQVIGIPTSLYLDRSSPVTSGRIRAIDAAKDLIEEAEAEVDAAAP